MATLSLIEETRTATKKGQITLPSVVRQVLHIKDGGSVVFVVQTDGSVLLRSIEPRSKSTAPDEIADPALVSFLALLGDDIAQHPDRVGLLPADLMARSAALFDDEDSTFDPYAEIEGETVI